MASNAIEIDPNSLEKGAEKAPRKLQYSTPVSEGTLSKDPVKELYMIATSPTPSVN